MHIIHWQYLLILTPPYDSKGSVFIAWNKRKSILKRTEYGRVLGIAETRDTSIRHGYVNTVMTSELQSSQAKSQNVVVRTMKQVDASQVAEIWRNGLAQTAGSYGLVPMRLIMGYAIEQYGNEAMKPKGDVGPQGSNLIDAWMKNDDRTMLVATSYSGVIVGCIGVKIGFDMKQQQPGSTVASVWRMSVAETWRRRGVGLLLMQAAEEWARRQGCTSMILETTNKLAAQFYVNKAGYREDPFPKDISLVHHYLGLVKTYTKSLDAMNKNTDSAVTNER
jgi:GNAT superfamily N-acetyltransferase